MRKTHLSVPMALVMHATSAPAQISAQSHLMNKAEFELFLHDLDRDTVQWINVASEVDISSLKDSLPEGRVKRENKAVSQQNTFSTADGR